MTLGSFLSFLLVLGLMGGVGYFVYSKMKADGDIK